MTNPYPVWLENWWKKQATQQTGARHFEDAQRELEAATRRLSDLFTTDRESRFGFYGKDETLLLAYGSFYFPQTFVRIQFPLLEALQLHGWTPKTENQPVRILDLGAGLGGATLGASLLLHDRFEKHQIEALAVDQSESSLAMLRRIARENASHFPRLRVKTARGDLKNWLKRTPSAERWDLIIASFSLGEAFFAADDEAAYNWLQDTLRKLRPGGLLLITEPALRETSERLERLRNRVAAENSARIWAPCPHHRDCPLLADGRYWCHEVRSWQIPESLSFVNRRLFRSVKDLKFSFLLLGSPTTTIASDPHVETAEQMRLVSPMSAMKGRYVWAGCAGDGLRYEYEIQKRELNREQERELMAIERGDMIRVTASDALENPQKRRVKTISAIERYSQVTDKEAPGNP